MQSGWIFGDKYDVMLGTTCNTTILQWLQELKKQDRALVGFSSVSSKGRKWGRLPPSVIFLGSALSCRSYPPPVLWPLTFLHSDCVCYCPGAGDSEQGDCPGRRCRESLPEKLLGSLTRGQHVGTWCGANAVKKKKKKWLVSVWSVVFVVVSFPAVVFQIPPQWNPSERPPPGESSCPAVEPESSGLCVRNYRAASWVTSSPGPGNQRHLIVQAFLLIDLQMLCNEKTLYGLTALAQRDNRNIIM